MDSKEFLREKNLLKGDSQTFKIITEEGDEIILNDLLDEYCGRSDNDKYIRLLADFDNYKKRVMREKEDLVSKTKFTSLSSIVDLYDYVNLSLKFFNGETLDSLLILLNKVKNFLKSEGVEEVQVDKYDPDIHEVVQVLETGKEEIVEVLSRGYSIGGKILKYPKIILSK